MALQKVISVTGKKIILSDFGKTESTVLGDANAIAQAYVHLKSLPEFSGARGC